MKKINNTNPFKTPEGYFEVFEGKLLDRLKKENSIIPKRTGFQIPEGYFYDLHESIQQKLEVGETKVIPLKSYKKYYYTAASIAAIALVVFGLNWNDSVEIGFEDLANSEIETYFEDNELGLSTYDIAEVLPLDELEIGDFLENRFSDDTMLDYLEENLDDYEILNLEGDE